MKTEFKPIPSRSYIGESVEDDAFVNTGPPDSARSHLLEPFRDSVFGIGVVLLLLSGGAFLLYDLLADPRRGSSVNTSLMLVHYGVAVAYSIILLTNGFLKLVKNKAQNGQSARWVGLLLWLISAYALNREVSVFQQSTPWLCWMLVLTGAAMVLTAWKEFLSVRVQQLVYAVLAVGWWVFVYLSIYLAKLYPVSVPMLIALGLSVHSFVPLLFAIALGRRLWNDTRRDEHLRLGVGAGLLLPLLILGGFLSGWLSDLSQIERIKTEATIRKTSDLPDWVLVAQQLKPNRPVMGWVTKRLLLSNRIYDQGHFFESNGWGLGMLTSLDDARQHDPLVVIASQLFPADVLQDDEQLALIKVLLGNRHGAEEKFWTGQHLTTEEVVSQVKIWPTFRVSYTEQTLRIRNQARNATEEGLMTFHLPPGSVVSAMSLWVNGTEQPARLTTVAKADSAYRQVVNVESKAYARDPSVVYWQEGNRVTVRVFPCRAGDDRRVKLGITSPLNRTDNQLIYQPPYIEGPDAGSARAFVSVEFATPPTELKTPWLFDKLSGNVITHRGSYTPDWSLEFAAPPLAAESFQLSGKSYHLEPQAVVNEHFTPTDVYLDVNKSWQEDEFTTAYWEATKQAHSRVWVFDDGLKQLSPANLDTYFGRLQEQAFSLFPVYRITNPSIALLITKGTTTSPILSDLRHSPFADHLALLTKQTAPVRTFCYIADANKKRLSPYLKTLAELAVLNVTHGNTADLISQFNKRQFPAQLNTPDRVTLPDAGMAIRETGTEAMEATFAPDHLARLFAYNHLLNQIGRHYFTKNYQTGALIDEAQRAHIVSPLSSLIVLETQADYERFGIKKDFSGLDNATLKQEGAVPEPHEWALILLVMVFLGWLFYTKRYAIR